MIKISFLWREDNEGQQEKANILREYAIRLARKKLVVFIVTRPTLYF